MAAYWALFAFFAAGAIIAGSFTGENVRRPGAIFAIGAVAMTLMIGLRYNVGGDWQTYEFIYYRAGPLAFADALSIGDPAYQAVNWVAYNFDGDVWLVNSICAIFFVWGLFRLCRTQPYPWLALLVAVPYAVIVIAMGYTRQAVALGLIMAGIADFLRGGSVLRFGIYVAAAALFHKTAIVAFPVVALATERNRLVNMLIVLAGGILLYDLFLGDAMDNFVQNYIRAAYSAQGAAIRIGMNMLAAAVLWLGRRKLELARVEWKVWRNFSLASVASLVFLVMSPSSAAVDRISLYIIPLQMAVLGRVPLIFKSRLFGTVVVASYCFAVEFVWLNFAQFSDAWVPYQLFAI
ncbi:MAG TPA: EpsG family protein [Sphingomicrobium sp.]|nr:EpsG family protein [Sphingomicrobium sp.]